MSSKRDGGKRTRLQKFPNATAFKNDKYDNSKAKLLNEMRVTNVCQRCKDIIAWKIKYAKYKSLTSPSTCVKCSLKKVKYAYHTACTECAVKEGICAKCLKEHEVVESPEPDAPQRQREEVELREGLKAMSLRERTTFLRQIERDQRNGASTKKKSGGAAKKKCESDEDNELSDEDLNDIENDNIGIQ